MSDSQRPPYRPAWPWHEEQPMNTSNDIRLDRLRGPRQQGAPAATPGAGSAALPDTWLFHDGAPSYMDEPHRDALMSICLELGAALWATRRRLGLLKQLLEEQGTISRDALHRVRFQEDQEEWQAKRTEFVDRLLGSATAIVADATLKSDGG